MTQVLRIINNRIIKGNRQKLYVRENIKLLFEFSLPSISISMSSAFAIDSSLMDTAYSEKYICKLTSVDFILPLFPKTI